MTIASFAKAFRVPRSNPQFTPEMKVKKHAAGAPPRGLIHAPRRNSKGRFTPIKSDGDPSNRQRRVYTILHHMSGIRWRSTNTCVTHADYLCRTHRTELETENEAFFDRSEDGVDGRSFAERVDYDDSHYRIVLAPLDGDKIAASPGGMKGFVRETMAAVEKDLGVKISWVAVIHRKRDALHEKNHHAHVVLRAVDGRGHWFRISPEHEHTTLRECAQRAATRAIGEMPKDELQAYLDRKEARRERQRPKEREAEAGR